MVGHHSVDHTHMHTHMHDHTHMNTHMHSAGSPQSQVHYKYTNLTSFDAFKNFAWCVVWCDVCDICIVPCVLLHPILY